MPAAIAEGSTRPVEDVDEEEFELSPPADDSSLSSSFMPKSSSRQSSREMELLTSLLLMVLLTVPVETVDPPTPPPSTLRTFIRGTLLLRVLLLLAAIDFRDDSDRRVVEAEFPVSVEFVLLLLGVVVGDVVAGVVGDDPVVL